MTRRNITLWLVAGLMLLATLLAACDSGGDDGDGNAGFVHVELGAEETKVAQTATARANPTATVGPTPTVTLTSTPYVRPTDDPDMDGDMVITRVGNVEITLDDYRARVRFERYRLMYPILKLTEKQGPEKVLDLTNDANWVVESLFTTLADSISFGGQTQRLMVIEAIALQEAIDRGIEVDPYIFEANVAEYLALLVGVGGALPPEYDARYAEFLEGIDKFAGMNEEDFHRIVRARTLYDQLRFIISQEANLNPEETAVGVEMEDAIVGTQEEADDIAYRLVQGEPLQEIMESLGHDQVSPATSRILRYNDQNLPEALLEQIFTADEGDIIGPAHIAQGWYVGKVGPEAIDALSPDEIEDVRERHFLDWVEAQMDNPDIVEDFDNWINFTPEEPLPLDVSPLFHDDNFILPEPEATPQPE